MRSPFFLSGATVVAVSVLAFGIKFCNVNGLATSSLRNICSRRSVPNNRYVCLRMASDRDAADLARDRNDARLDVRNFMTQRAIQSFIYLSDSMRDPISVKWIEDFLNTTCQLKYHGYGAEYMERFGGTWDGPLLEMIERPKEVITVSKKRNRGTSHRGLATMPMERRITNPYLEETYVEYDIDIDPVSMASRILSLREQIAREWDADLDVISAANEKIMGSYFQQLAKEEREQKDGEDDSESAPAFERFATNLFNQKISFVSSPNSLGRRGNFDLLYNLCTQTATHRLIRELRDTGEAKETSFQVLNRFYSDHVGDYFDGDQKYGRADDFLEKLLLEPPSIITNPDGSSGLSDPIALVEQIIQKRNEIVSEWKDVMREIPKEHNDAIRRLIMDKQLEAWGARASPTGVDESSKEGFE